MVRSYQRRGQAEIEASSTEVVRLLQAYFDGERVPLQDVPVDLEYETSVPHALR